jgi:hypothetical protein
VVNEGRDIYPSVSRADRRLIRAHHHRVCLPKVAVLHQTPAPHRFPRARGRCLTFVVIMRCEAMDGSPFLIFASLPHDLEVRCSQWRRVVATHAVHTLDIGESG